MKYLPYILKHLRKTWIRTLSTVAAIALCIFLISVLQTALQAFYGGMENASTERLITRHRVSLTENIPIAYQPRIAAIPGIKRVAQFTWFGGSIGAAGGQPDWKNFFPNFAVEAEPFLAMYPEYQLKPDEIISRLSPLAEPGKPFFGTAGEMVALATLAKGDRNGAGQMFARIAEDQQVPQSIRSRAIQFAGSLGVDASAALPAEPAANPAQ